MRDERDLRPLYAEDVVAGSGGSREHQQIGDMHDDPLHPGAFQDRGADALSTSDALAASNSSDAARIDRLESDLALLRQELAAVRAALQAPIRANTVRVQSTAPSASGAQAPPHVGGPSPARPPLIATPRADFWRSLPSFEELLGRYGILALATITGLAAVGKFLAWAVSRALLGPTVRVVLGALAAIAIGTLGVRLRRRGLRDFGNVLLALSLAVVHLVSWSAGPLLHVVPSVIALGTAFASSVLLAEFALRNDEQALFAVGFGGALLAPFIASDPNGSVPLLGLYGLAVVSLAAAALRDRPWTLARRIVGTGFGMYLLALVAGAMSSTRATARRCRSRVRSRR